LDSNVVERSFVPGTAQSATVVGFGSVFTDVSDGHSTKSNSSTLMVPTLRPRCFSRADESGQPFVSWWGCAGEAGLSRADYQRESRLENARPRCVVMDDFIMANPNRSRRKHSDVYRFGFADAAPVGRRNSGTFNVSTTSC
jgi:hypothetical protein